MEPLNFLTMLQPEIKNRCDPMLREGELLGAAWDGLHERIIVQGVVLPPSIILPGRDTQPVIRNIGQFHSNRPGGSVWVWHLYSDSDEAGLPCYVWPHGVPAEC